MLLAALCVSSAAFSQGPTFHHDIEPLLQEHCQECHRPQGVAPFSLLDYQQTRAWGRRIGEVVADGTMPPWHADPRYGEFANDRRLKQGEREVFSSWVRARFPKGDASERPPPAEFSDGWRIGQPDVVIELPEEVTIPPAGEVPYHNYVVPVPFDQDVWVSAAEARPGNPKVVHHIIVESFHERPTLAAPGDDPRTLGSLGGYVPGDGPLLMPAGLGRRLPAGAKILFQMHYTPTGEEQKDRSSLGLVLAKEPPRYESRTGLVSTPFIWIPAGAMSKELQADWTFPKDAMLLSMRPHMHLRGKTFEYRAVYPNGEEEVLLLVSPYDFNWQTTYQMKEPKTMPAGTKLVCTATYDNSAGNRNNPDPTRDVSWGEQTSDEMMIGFFDYYFVE